MNAKNYSCLDGSMVENMIVPIADANVLPNEFNEDLSAMNGEDYSGIVPLIALSQTKKGQEAVKGTFLDKDVMAQNRASRQARRDQRFQTRMEAKTNRNQAKLTTAEALKEGSKDDGTSQAIASLGAPASASNSASGTNGSTKYILIGVGALVLIGGAYFLLRKKK